MVCCGLSSFKYQIHFIISNRNTNTWKQHQKLAGHQLTITQMKFSPDDKYILSVSRDRRLSVFENKPTTTQDFNYELIATSDKKNGIHGRIIWTCDWSHDSKHFATGSRDGKCVMWYRDENETSTASTLGQFKSAGVLDEPGQSLTAIAFAHSYLNNSAGTYLIAIGCESGQINLFSFASEWKLLLRLGANLAHHLTVKKLAFRPLTKYNKKIQLASCGDDHLVRIYEVL